MYSRDIVIDFQESSSLHHFQLQKSVSSSKFELRMIWGSDGDRYEKQSVDCFNKESCNDNNSPEGGGKKCCLW